MIVNSLNRISNTGKVLTFQPSSLAGLAGTTTLFVNASGVLSWRIGTGTVQKITDYAVGSSYLPLTGGTLTGTLYLKGGATPLYIDQDISYTTFRTTAGVTKHDFVSGTVDFQLNNYTPTGGIIFRTNSLERARFTSDGSLLIGSTSTDGVNALQVDGSVKSTQYRLSALNTAPSSATDTGTLGEIRVTAGYIYVCTATNTWVRTALATW